MRGVPRSVATGGFSPGYPAPGMAPQPPMMIGPPKAPGISIAALVLGIVSVCVPYVNFVTMILAIVFGVIGINKANRDPTTVGGKGMAIAGLVLGIIAAAFWLIVFIFFFSFIAGLGSLPKPTPSFGWPI